MPSRLYVIACFGDRRRHARCSRRSCVRDSIRDSVERERSLSEIWRDNPAFNAFRGTAWMPEPCRSCERREIDWGGCRCQALALTGDAAATDPACFKSPDHERVAAIAAADAGAVGKEMRWRSFRVSPAKVAAQ